MLINFQNYPDVVFLNRKLMKTRFRRNLLLFCGVNASGKTIIQGVALLKEENLLNLKFAVEKFLEAGRQVVPACFIIERFSMLRTVF